MGLKPLLILKYELYTSAGLSSVEILRTQPLAIWFVTVGLTVMIYIWLLDIWVEVKVYLNINSRDSII